MKRMFLFTLLSSLVVLVSIDLVLAQSDEAKISNAVSSAIPSITENATIMDWPSEPGGELRVIREGTNGWTCLPDMPSTPGNDPMCLDDPWLTWADAWMNKQDVNISTMGFGYMLQENTAESNVDPYPEGPTEDNEWMPEGVPHVMIIVPDNEVLSGLSTDPNNGGPWVMWRGTPYVHIMVPLPQNPPAEMDM